MAKPVHRSYSRYAREAVELLGIMIHNARIERGLTVAELAERAGVSRGLVHRIEQGEMSASIGVAFELAAVLGLRLFNADLTTLTQHLSTERSKLALLPRSARKKSLPVNDDF